MSDKLVSLYAIDNMLSKLSGMYHIEDIRAMISRVPAAEINTEPHWISVEDKLPSDMDLDWVLVCVIEASGFRWPMSETAEYRKSSDDWYIEGVGWMKKEHKGFFAVTHWMPLPEIPEE